MPSSRSFWENGHLWGGGEERRARVGGRDSTPSGPQLRSSGRASGTPGRFTIHVAEFISDQISHSIAFHGGSGSVFGRLAAPRRARGRGGQDPMPPAGGPGRPGAGTGRGSARYAVPRGAAGGGGGASPTASSTRPATLSPAARPRGAPSHTRMSLRRGLCAFHRLPGSAAAGRPPGPLTKSRSCSRRCPQRPCPAGERAAVSRSRPRGPLWPVVRSPRHGPPSLPSVTTGGG